jgi:hypothetical protein
MSQEAGAMGLPQSSGASPTRQSGRLRNTTRMDDAVAAEALEASLDGECEEADGIVGREMWMGWNCLEQV